MADRIKGITIEIGGNTSKLQDSLKDVNKSLKDTQGQLRDVDKLLKLDPSNIELLAQKQELLSRASEETAEKLKTLKEAQQAMKDAGVDELSDDYMKVQREITECEQQQKKFTEEAKNTDKQILSIGSGMDKVAQKAKKASEVTSGISKAAGGALVALVGAGVKTAEMADDMNTMSKQSGLTTDTLQKMQYASALIDVDLDTAVGAVSKMKKNLDQQGDAWERIGVKTKDANGNYRATEDIFFDVISALGNIENETERDTIAMDLFGRSADELAGYIDDGGRAYRELSAQAEASGAIVSQEDLDKANQLNDTLDKLKATLGGELAQAGISVAEALTPVLEKVAEIIGNIGEHLKNLSPETVQVIAIVLGLIAALSPLLSLLASISMALPILTPLFSALAGVLAGPVGIAIMAVVGVCALLMDKWELIKTSVEAIKEAVPLAWEHIKTKVTEAIDSIKEKIDAIKQKFEEFKNKVQEIWDTIVGIFKGEIPMPKIKMPHITVTGDWSFNPPSAPKFGVEWYNKAMDDAYILNGATIFGSQNGSLLGGGESGSETIVGTEKLMEMMSEVVGNQNVTVVLQGDASEVFRLVRTENNRYFNQYGKSPLRV